MVRIVTIFPPLLLSVLSSDFVLTMESKLNLKPSVHLRCTICYYSLAVLCTFSVGPSAGKVHLKLHSVTFDLFILEIMFLFFKNTLKILKFRYTFYLFRNN